jgi:O-antigen/teichoic acid export membrane protein
MPSTLRIVGTGVAWNTVATVLVKVLGLASVFLILSRLSVYDYGLVQLVLTVVSTIGGFLLPGLGTVLISDFARLRGEGKIGEVAALARQYVLLQLVLGVLAFLVLFLGSTLLATHLHQPTIGYYLQIVSFSYLAGVVRGLLTVLVTVELRFAFQSVLLVLDEACKLVFLIIGFWLGLGLVGVLYATVLTPVAVTILTLPWGARSLRPILTAPSPSEPWWKLITDHRFWGISASYLTTLNQNVRLWLVQLFLGTEAVGLFSFAQGLASQALGLVTYSQITTPLIARATHEVERFTDLANRGVKYQLWVALILIIPGMAITPFFITYLFPAYHEAIVSTLILLTLLIPSSINVAVAAVYTALQQQRQYFFRATLVKTFLIIILLPILIPFFGITGVALEYTITNYVSVIERTRSLRHLLPGFLRSFGEFFVLDASDRDLFRRLRGIGKGMIARAIVRNNS